MNLYVLVDRVAGRTVGGVYALHGDAVAVRMLQDAAADGQSMVAKHPADFDLVRIGSFDEESGQLAQVSAPEVVVRGAILSSLTLERVS